MFDPVTPASARSFSQRWMEGPFVMPTKEAQAQKQQPKQATAEDREQARRAVQMSMDTRQ
jgi:hypothetical protein